MDHVRTIAIDAPPAVVWEVVADVESWPEWTRSVRAVERLDDGPFGLASRARIRQPGFPPMVWEVTSFAAGRSFTWTTRSPGVESRASHELAGPDEGPTTVTLGVSQEGWAGGLVRVLLGPLTRRYLDMEAQGLKARCER